MQTVEGFSERTGESMKTEILKIKGDWMEVASDCRSTVGKPQDECKEV